MPTRAEVELLRTAQAELTRRVRADLASLAGSLSGSPQAIRDLLLQVVPSLVAEYGEVAAAVSAEWFEEVYGARATMAQPIGQDYVAKGVKYTAGHLFQENPAATFAALDVKLDQWIKQAGRDTLKASSERQGYGWARVPSGDKTCSFCLIMASRGATFNTRRSAGDSSGTGVGDDYHGDCDCQVVAVRSEADYPEGYDPDALHKEYEGAWDDLHDDPGLVAELEAFTARLDPGDKHKQLKRREFAMRRTRPDLVTDAVHTH